MPHVLVKLWPGKSEQQKTRLAEEIAKDVMGILHYGEESVSVAIEEVESRDWAEKVSPLKVPPHWERRSAITLAVETCGCFGSYLGLVRGFLGPRRCLRKAERRIFWANSTNSSASRGWESS